MVLWIGYLQWHYRTRGNVNPPEPILQDFHNIEHRDAVRQSARGAVAGGGLPGDGAVGARRARAGAGGEIRCGLTV